MDVTVAAFDVDNTLTVRDCVMPFMRRVSGAHVLLRTVVSQPLTVFSLLKNKDRNSLKALFVSSVFTGRLESEVNELGVLFAWTPVSDQSVTMSRYALEVILDSIKEKNTDLSEAYPPASEKENLFDAVKQLRNELNELETLVMSLRSDVVRLDSIQNQQRKREQWEKRNPYLQ